ncbi:hypothetical protein [Kitasatospora phosalacinea]|uniref:Uncharacterized protein n=1 Tax=Kitasatospora phosalacinea TaxID=2065 RepID=A0A9W6UM08_9ACTN|nr:hypothetical protein [Kitasatospora phosalacinea]GLW52708.1 hypothetical protein Kpho01_07190 [Kitasatospora phosalacinea]
MSDTPAERLLAAVEPLAHADRLRTVARTAHALAATGELPSLIAELAERGRYERRLAALAALAGRHTPHLTARLADPDAVVRRYAHRAIRRLPVPDEAVAQAVAAAPTAVRAELVAAVLRSGRTALAERLVAALSRSHGPRAAAPLLPLCSAAFVTAELPAYAHAVDFTAALGHRHPQAVLDAVEPQLADRTAWSRHVHALAAAARHLPLRVLDLLERRPGGPPLPRPLRDRLADLAAADPTRTARLLAVARSRRDTALRPAVARRLAAADPSALADLVAQQPGHGPVLLRALPPARRPALHDSVYADLYRRVGYYAEALALLPAADRYPRARAEIHRLRRNQDGDLADWLAAPGPPPVPTPADLLSLVALLPPAEARPRLLAETRLPEPTERAYGWEELIGNAARSGDPAAVSELLPTLARRLRNEQDPVRWGPLSALAELAPVLHDGHAADLHRLTEEALTTRDCSEHTRAGLTDTAVAVLARHPSGTALAAWATRTLERTGAPRITLPRGRERAVLDALRPLLRDSAATPDAALLLTVADALGPRARRVLAEPLARALRTGTDEARCRALDHLVPLDPATALDLLTRDPSAARSAPVRAVLTAVRTDLLALLPGDLTEADTATADRWTPRQQQDAASRLAATAADPDRPAEERAAALRAAAPLGDVGTALLRRWAADPDTALAETALAALPHTADPASVLPDLLALAGHDRARVALYAADRPARHTPADALAPALRAIVLGPAAAKVTSRKQAVRLAARHLPAETAAELLLAAHLAPEQHADVRTVTTAETTDRIGDTRADEAAVATGARWALLADTVERGSTLQRLRVLDPEPHRLPPADRSRYAALVVRMLDLGDSIAEHVARGRLVGLAEHAPEAVADLARAVLAPDDPDDPDRPDRWKSAAHGLVAIAVGAAPHPTGGCAPGSVLAGLLTTLTGAVRADEQAGEHARERLDELLDRLGSLWDAPNLPEVRRAVAAILLPAPALRAQAARQLLATVAVTDPEIGDTLLAVAALLPDRPALAADLAATLRHSLGTSLPADAPALDAARRLTAEGTLAAGLFAVALTGAGSAAHWPEPWRALLRELRHHPAADVRDRAHAVRPPRPAQE